MKTQLQPVALPSSGPDPKTTGVAPVMSVIVTFPPNGANPLLRKPICTPSCSGVLATAVPTGKKSCSTPIAWGTAKLNGVDVLAAKPLSPGKLATKLCVPAVRPAGRIGKLLDSLVGFTPGARTPDFSP